MGKKKAKANARLAADEFHVDLVPYDGTLPPQIARLWVSKLQGFVDLLFVASLSAGHGVADEGGDDGSFAGYRGEVYATDCLRGGIEEMMTACFAALEGRPVNVRSSFDEAPHEAACQVLLLSQLYFDGTPFTNPDSGIGGSLEALRAMTKRAAGVIAAANVKDRQIKRAAEMEAA